MGVTRLTGYDRALFELRTMTRDLALKVRAQMESALKNLKKASAETVDLEEEIDEERDRIVNRCIEVMCLQQLRTQDLHWILGFKRIAEALERIGDYARDVSELNDLEHEKWVPDIHHMAEHLLDMFDYTVEVLDEKREPDIDLDENDDFLDETYCRLKQELVDASKMGNRSGNLGLTLVLARTIERMGDHVVNVGEMLLYAQTGHRRLSECREKSFQERK